MKEIPEYAVLLDTVSKRWALCGARVGIFLSLNKALVGATMRLAMARLSAGLIDQAVAAALTKVPNSYLVGVIEEYRKRRDLLYAGLSAIPGVSLPKPEGAFYMMVSLPVDDAEKFSKYLLESYRSEKNETLMLAPGGGFYADESKGRNQVRIAYILNQDDLKTCLQILEGALAAYTQSSK
jgi:aspartate aminotransferase